MLALAGCVSLVNGQSGRRTNTTPPPPSIRTEKPVVTERASIPVDTSSIGSESPKMIVKVMAEVAIGMRRKIDTPERIQSWTIERLNDSVLLDVRGLGEGRRSEAMKAAKAETEAYVVFLQLEDGSSSIEITADRPPAGEAWINLTVFTPVTAREKLSRRILLRQTAPKGANLPAMITTCHPGVFGNDFLLLQASIEAAEQVMHAFQIPIPRGCR